MRAWLVAASTLGAGLPAAAQIFDNPLPPLSRPHPAIPVPEVSDPDEPARAPEPAGIVLERDENGSITLTVPGASRRAVLEELGYGDVAEWRDPEFADQTMHGRFTGDSGAIVRRILERGNFLIVYADDAGAQRIARIVIYGAKPLASAPGDAPARAAVAKPVTARPGAQTPAAATAKKEQQRRSADEVRRRQRTGQ
jgi:hypothetical protein